MSLGWRVDVSATDRYGSIQTMASLRGIDVSDAIAAEEAAFNESQSLVRAASPPSFPFFFLIFSFLSFFDDMRVM